MIASSLTVDVAQPQVDGERVVFSWTQSEPNPFQRVNEFFFRYEGIELSRFSTELFYEMFLGLQLRVFAGFGRPVELRFPSPVPRSTVDYWRAFHDADDVTISPVMGCVRYDAWNGHPAPLAERRQAAVFFGGGKDSTLAVALLSEIVGADEVLLIQFVGPLRPDRELEKLLELRQEQLMLRPTREALDVTAQRVWTDFQAQFRQEGYRFRPNLELYTVGSLPLFLAWRTRLSTFSIHWAAYSIGRNNDRTRRYRYARSRPEVLATMSRHFETAIGLPTTVTNINLPIAGHLAFRLLVERYPEAVSAIVMCPSSSPDRRWCHSCQKCGLFALMSLSTGHLDRDFDYDVFFRRSAFIQQCISFAETGVEPARFGNAPWSPALSNERNSVASCHLLAKLDLDKLPAGLSGEAIGNITMLKALWGNQLFPEYEMIPRSALDALGSELGPRLTVILEEHFTLIDHVPEPHLQGNMTVDYDFDHPMPTRTADVPHLRRDE